MSPTLSEPQKRGQEGTWELSQHLVRALSSPRAPELGADSAHAQCGKGQTPDRDQGSRKEGVSHCACWSGRREVHGGSKREGWSSGRGEEAGSGFKGKREESLPSERMSKALDRSEAQRVSQRETGN